MSFDDKMDDFEYATAFLKRRKIVYGIVCVVYLLATGWAGWEVWKAMQTKPGDIV